MRNETVLDDSLEGFCVRRERVRRIMREYGLFGARHRRFVITTKRDRDARPAPDLVQRNFVADAPNRLWVADLSVLQQHRRRLENDLKSMTVREAA
jgi:transposase InsO family protein